MNDALVEFGEGEAGQTKAEVVLAPQDSDGTKCWISHESGTVLY